ncbi:hypothetical protein BU24DRAFT_494347 [Aaosphaeria arxii CBS 175.79]|uniref:Uncharacterized protein n=1 Tax=Aaosphaeria arxii CBS 175.79 TaxID=1450172 RepID=A0A6A5XNQ6_9PLEO|nr:uncharacterized protein BU24DRAFT_494347 [Aaosphaeria arxii CBS 175.79]KAF2013984.1 hypothetical protein BU24DRAFT_494347 [Aaosphaeria arxii CBS 175.79]
MSSLPDLDTFYNWKARDRMHNHISSTSKAKVFPKQSTSLDSWFRPSEAFSGPPATPRNTLHLNEQEHQTSSKRQKLAGDDEEYDSILETPASSSVPSSLLHSKALSQDDAIRLLRTIANDQSGTIFTDSLSPAIISVASNTPNGLSLQSISAAILMRLSPSRRHGSSLALATHPERVVPPSPSSTKILSPMASSLEQESQSLTTAIRTHSVHPPQTNT